MNKTPTQPKNLKETVLAKLEGECIQPRPKLFWHCQSCLVWVLWGGSVLLGAVSVAVLIFAAAHMRFALYEATHDTPLSFALEVLPYIWVVVFVLMAALAYFNFRHTKRGYRYPLAQVVISSLVFSIIGGAVLHLAGVGQALDARLGAYMKTYHSLEERELARWQRPKAGRLVGRMVSSASSSSVVVFTDRNRSTWQLETMDLHAPDRRVLLSGKQVRVLGLDASTTARTLHACGVFPWMFERNIKLSDMERERKGFIERMYAHKDRIKAREQALTQEVFGDKAMGRCADMPVIKRISESMR